MSKSIVVVGSGHAAMCAGIAALEGGAQVIMFEKADKVLAGGNTKYIAGAMRFAYDNGDDLLPLLQNPDDPRLAVMDFGAYPVTGGITFTYGRLKVSEHGAVQRQDETKTDGLFASSELVGGVFFNGYSGGSGLTSGAVFGRLVGAGVCAG